MTPNPRWWSQPFPAEGSQTASGIRRQLGRTELDPVSVLVRESVQNCWDARLPGVSPISVTFSLDRLGTRAVEWRDRLVPDGTGPELGKLPTIKSCLTTDDYVLTISDRGTTGLGGPLRANEPVRPGEVANFVQFIRNAGEPRDQVLGGGTYGFGKSILYSFSRCSTILVRTRCPEGEVHRDRLIGAALGETFTDQDGHRHTGRHWWGVVGEDNVPDPLLAETAGRTAGALGLPDRSEGTGTDIVIVAPDLGLDGIDGDPRRLAERLVAAIVWNLWPKFGSSRRGTGIEFTVSVDGQTVPIPSPESIPVVDALSGCLDDIHEMGLEGEGVETRKSAPHIVGKLAFRTVPASFPPASTLPPSVHAVIAGCPMTESSQTNFRHVARMRPAELVVDYLECAPFKLTSVGYVGVYRASELADEYFAESEPPTHDSWQPAGLSGTARGVVVNHKKFVKDASEKIARGGDGGPSKTVQGLGRLSATLGSLIDTSTGIAPNPPRPSTARSGKKTVRKARVSVPAHVEISDGGPMVRARVEVPEKSTMFVVEAESSVQLAGGGREKEGPEGSSTTTVTGWRRPDGSDSRSGPRLFVQPGEGGDWIVEATAVDDAAVRITVSQEEL